MACLLTVPSAKNDQIENESGPFSYRKADCNTTFQFISVRMVQNWVYTSLGNLARLLKLIQETSQSTSER